MDRRQYLAGLGLGSATIAGCITSNWSGDSSVSEPIETTFEGEESALKELEVERDGAIFFELDASDGIDVTIIPEDESGRGDSVGLPSDLPIGEAHAGIEPGNYALDIEAGGDWSIRVEQNPVLQPADVDEPDYPLEIEGNYRAVFGPYYFDGFRSFSISSNVLMAVRFIDGRGELIERRRIDGTAFDGEDEREPLNIDSVCWIECAVGGREWTRPDEIKYQLTIDEPD